MSDYTAAPQYGTPYIPGYSAPSASAYQTSLSQYPYHAHAHAQGGSSGLELPPHANAYSYHANAQNVATQVKEVNCTRAESANRTYSHVLPSQSYPSASLPFDNSQFLQSSIQPLKHQTTPSNHLYHSSEPSSFCSPSRAQDPQLEHPKSVPPAASDLEDGEVDDEGIDNLSSLSRENEMGPKLSRFPQQGGSTENDVVVQSYSNGYINATQEPSIARVQGSLHDSSDQKTSPFNGKIYTMKESSVRSLSNTSALDLQTNSVDGGRVLTDKEISTLRSERGKQAILDLHSHGIDFIQIVDRGMNPELLRTLYAQFGLPVAPSQPPQAAQLGTRFQSIDAAKGNQTNGSNINSATQQINMPAQMDNSNSGSNSSLIKATQADAKTKSPSTAPVPKKSTSSSLLAKSSGAKPIDPKALDRKDYIARMLAAKSAKAVTTNTPSVPSKASTGVIPEVVTSQGPLSVATTQSLPTTTIAPPKAEHQPLKEASEILPQPLREDADTEAKRKAQTELARQKIEALKLQQVTRKATGSLLARQEYSASSSVDSPAQVSVPENVSRPPVPSRQSSYFSPISQKTPFSIPGLFMTLEPSQPVATLERGPTQQSVAPAQELQGDIRISEGSQQPPATTAVVNSRKPAQEAINKAESNPLAASGTAHRKRQKAADFLDSPSTRIKRPLGQQEDCSVIIDISDDEMADRSDLGNMDVDAIDNCVHPSNNSRPTDNATNKQQSTLNLPPLGEISSAKKVPVVTPSAAPVLQQTKGLKTKEMEIELMNRKIAELEQRINAKKTSSRAHTPGVSGSTTISSPSGQPSQDGGEKSGDAHEQVNGDSSHDSPEQTSLAAMDTADTIATEQKLHEVETAKAEVERSLAEDVAQASNEGRRLRQDEFQIAQELKQSTPRVNAQGSNAVESCELGEQQMHSEQLPPISYEEPSQENGETKPPERGKQQFSKAEHIRSQVEEEQVNLLEEQRRMRREAIESGLPFLDATMEKTKQKLDILRQEIEMLELEVRKGVEGRKALVDELETLSQPNQAQRLPDHQDSLLTDQGAKHPSQPLTRASPEFQPAAEIVDLRSPRQPQFADATTTGQAHVADSLPAQAMASSPHVEDEHSTDEDPEEDVMDISRSDLDEGESFHSRRELLQAEDQIMTGSVDDEEGYEPPNDINLLQQHNIDLDADHALSEGRSAEIEIPDITTSDLSTDKQEASLPPSDDEVIYDADTQRETQASPRSPTSESDDYEPPEPAPSVAEPTLRPSGTAADSKLASSISDMGANNVDASARLDTSAELGQVHFPAKTSEPHSQKAAAPESSPNVQHFTPYESPLKHFKSFRNHPRYLDEVSNGFRSLTYSNAANPDLPICRYEIDGVCNDSSCQSQHFRAFGLSDEKILVDLGKLPDRSDITTFDASAYTDGLRKLIQDIRSRKVKDVNEVASEITAYRRQFLGDFRILSL